MAANIKTGHFNKKHLANGNSYSGNSYRADGNGDHYDFDSLYILSIISSIILGGFAEALNKCDTYKGNNPLCIPAEEVIHRRLKGGSGALDSVNKYLDMAENASFAATQMGDTSALGKFMSLVQTINSKFLTIFENTSKAVLGVKNAANNPHMEQEITAFLDENKEMIKKMTRDPEVQAALREWVEEMGVLNIQLMDMAKPIIDRLISQSVGAINDAAVKATQGIISTSFNIVEAAIGEIPVAGGIFDIILDFMRGFNSAMQAAGPIVEFSTEAFFRALRTIFTTLSIVKNKSADIQRAVNKVEGAIKNISVENLEEKGRQAGEDYLHSVAKESGVTKETLTSDEQDKELEKRVAKLKETDTAMVEEKAKAKEKEKDKASIAIKGGAQVKKHRANIQKRIKHVTHRLRKTIRKFMRHTTKKIRRN